MINITNLKTYYITCAIGELPVTIRLEAKSAEDARFEFDSAINKLLFGEASITPFLVSEAAD